MFHLVLNFAASPTKKMSRSPSWQKTTTANTKSCENNWGGTAFGGEANDRGHHEDGYSHGTLESSSRKSDRHVISQPRTANASTSVTSRAASKRGPTPKAKKCVLLESACAQKYSAKLYNNKRANNAHASQVL